MKPISWFLPFYPGEFPSHFSWALIRHGSWVSVKGVWARNWVTILSDGRISKRYNIVGIIGDFNLSYKVVLMRPWVRFLKAQVVIKRLRLVPPHFLFDFSLWCNLSLLWTLLLWCHILRCCIVTSVATKEKNQCNCMILDYEPLKLWSQ